MPRGVTGNTPDFGSVRLQVRLLPGQFATLSSNRDSGLPVPRGLGNVRPFPPPDGRVCARESASRCDMTLRASYRQLILAIHASVSLVGDDRPRAGPATLGLLNLAAALAGIRGMRPSFAGPVPAPSPESYRRYLNESSPGGVHSIEGAEATPNLRRSGNALEGPLADTWRYSGDVSSGRSSAFHQCAGSRNPGGAAQGATPNDTVERVKAGRWMQRPLYP